MVYVVLFFKINLIHELNMLNMLTLYFIKYCTSNVNGFEIT